MLKQTESDTPLRILAYFFFFYIGQDYKFVKKGLLTHQTQQTKEYGPDQGCESSVFLEFLQQGHMHDSRPIAKSGTDKHTDGRRQEHHERPAPVNIGEGGPSPDIWTVFLVFLVKFTSD